MDLRQEVCSRRAAPTNDRTWGGGLCIRRMLNPDAGYIKGFDRPDGPDSAVDPPVAILTELGNLNKGIGSSLVTLRKWRVLLVYTSIMVCVSSDL